MSGPSIADSLEPCAPPPAAVPLLLLAVALAWCGGLDHPAPTAGLLALALVAVAVLRGPWWLQLLTIGAATHLAVRAVRIGDDPADVLPALLPSAWPLLAVLATALAALVRLDTVRPGRELPLVGHVVVGAALLGVAASGPVGWFFATLTFLGAVPEPADYRHAVGFALGSAALLVVAVPLLRLRWRSWSPVAPAALGLLVQAGVVAACLPRAGGWPSLDPAYVEWAALVPTSWPLGVLLLVAAVTGVPGRRPGRVEPWSTDAARPRSSV